MSEINQTIIVPVELAGERLDRVCAELFPDFSRSVLTRWIRSGDLKVNGDTVKPRMAVIGGETLTLATDRPVRESWSSAEAIELDILYDDEHVIVLNKPAGLVVHPGAGNTAGTLVNGLLNFRPDLEKLPRAGIVHRLDKDTSGAMVVAASDVAHTKLTQDIQARDFERLYLGVCEGRMVAGQDVDEPIGRDPHHRTRQAVRDDGKPAQTEFRVVERYRVHTLVKARLHTGRTHQIRVHLKSIGFPLVGDGRYGARGRVPPGAVVELVTLLQQFPRQALHAEHLSFTHPATGDVMEFSVPVPADIAELLAALREDAGRKDV